MLIVDATAVLTTSEAAAHLGISDQMLRIYMRRRVLVPLRKMGNTFVFNALDVEQFRVQRERTARSNPLSSPITRS